MISNNKPIGIDIFSGAGGLSLGAQKAGIHIAFAIEIEVYSAKTFKRNHPDSIVFNEDISKIKTYNLNIQNPTIVFGGPPCQGFSLSNSKTRNNGNQNNLMYKEFIRFVKELNPTWFLFENVEGIVSFNKGKTIEMIKNSFEKLGYKVNSKILLASDYGVPQVRNRFIMVGNRKGINFEFPQKQLNIITVKDAIGDLPVLTNGQMDNALPYRVGGISTYAKKMRNGSKIATQNFVSRNKNYVIERYKHIKPGQNWKGIPEELMLNYKNSNNCHSGIYKRLKPDEPSIVISNYRKNMLIHPEQDRGLSVREAARLQSFPDNFIFEGTLSHIQQQIGNAVPPLLAEAIFKQIMTY